MSGPPWTILNYAFRPFFLLNGLFAMAVMAVWVMALHGIEVAPAAREYDALARVMR